MEDAVKDFSRATSEKVEHTDYHSTDISTFVNNHFVFYVPPPQNRELERPYYGDGYMYRRYYGGHRYVVANMSTVQLFSYENGAKVVVEWLNGTAINGTSFDYTTNQWRLENYATVKWLDDLPSSRNVKKRFNLGEYETKEIQLNAWMVYQDYRLLSGVVKITSDYPISVMHHRLYPLGTLDYNGYELINEDWDGVYSAYGKKLFTRITGDCWISALEADTVVQIWDYSDRNDDATLNLDRFEGWAYSRNPIFEQYGFDDDLVLISADKPVSIVAGLQGDQGFTQVFGKDGKDFLFPCFGKILIHSLTGATIDLEDKSGNQGSYKGTLSPGEMKVFDFKVAYKLKYYSSFEWAHLRSSEPILVYTYANNEWYLDEDDIGLMAGEEYFTVYKKITEFYPHGYVPYPVSTEFKIPLRSRAYLTVVNLDKKSNDVKIDFEELLLPYELKMSPYESVTVDYSENSYYPMNLINPQTQTRENPSWLHSDPDRRYALDHIPRISVHEVGNVIDPEHEKWVQKVSWENITKGSTVNIKATHPVLVFINYNKDQPLFAQGMDLIPGLSPPAMRGLPEPPTMIVLFSGMVVAADMVMIAVGRRSIVELF
jgi:hypothetical protein